MTIDKQGLGPFYILCLLGFATFFSSYLRIPVLPLYAAELGAGPAEVGGINGAFLLTAGFLSIPAGLLADRFGSKLPVTAGIAAIALSSLLVTWCRLPVQMAGAYVIFGIGLAAFAPAMLSRVADAVPAERLGTAYGWYTTAVYIAMTLGPASGGYLAKQLGLRQVFAVSAGLLALVFLAALPLLSGGGRRHRTGLHGALAGTFSLLRNLPLTACLLATAGSCIGFGVFMTFLPLYAAGHGYDPAQVGLVFAVQALTNVVVRIPLGMIADRINRRWLVVTGLILLAAALFLIGQTARLELLLACVVLLGVGMALTYTAIGALIAELAPAIQRGLAMGMYSSCIYLGMMAGATVMGLALKRIGYPAGFAAAGAICLLTLLLFLPMMGKDYRSSR